MSGTGAARVDNLIQGKCSINGFLLTILYDSDATHSFISYDCVRQLNLLITSLPYDPVVSIPTYEHVKTSLACLNCPIDIEGRNFLINLICLPLSQLDIVLGMDWLSANHVFLNCYDKILIFESSSTSVP